MELNPLVQISVQQRYFPELYRLYFPLAKNVPPPFILFVAPTIYGLPYPFPQTYRRLGSPNSQKEKGYFPTPEKSPSPNSNFHVITQYKLHL